MKIKSLCRPVESVYCIKCCVEGRPSCPNLDTIGKETDDNLPGCKNYNGNSTKYSRTIICTNTVCYSPSKLEDEKTQNKLEEYFKNSPKGIYDPTEILALLNLR